MLPRLTQIRALLAVLVALLALRAAPAWAQDDEKESDIEEETGNEDEDTGKIDPNQPSVYTGGRYTIDTFPLSELDRTLLLVQGILELRADLGIDMTKGQTFETMDIALAARYGVNDTLELQAGIDLTFLTPDFVEDKPISAFAAVEGSIMYDLLDWRVGVGIPLNPDVAFDIFVGLPVKIRILKDRLAIVALEQILTVHTDKDAADETRKPDLTISLGFLVQVIKQFAVIVRGQVTSVGFEGDPVVAIKVDAQYTVNNRVDLGIFLILKNLTAKEAMSGDSVPLDNRGIGFFLRFRI